MVADGAAVPHIVHDVDGDSLAQKEGDVVREALGLCKGHDVLERKEHVGGRRAGDFCCNLGSSVFAGRHGRGAEVALDLHRHVI